MHPIIEKKEKTFDGEVKRLAEKYEQNETLAKKIIECESNTNPKAYQHNREPKINEAGNIVWIVWSTDWGYWQVNDYYHKDRAKKLGFDIHNEWDNLEFGFILLKQQGSRPWSASKKCWDK